MRTVSIREARQKLRALLDDVAAGEEIVLVRRGKAVARLVPAGDSTQRLPSLADFRHSIQLRGTTLGEELAAVREEERY
ncbi:MAG TPA: type II toxin-antitoxin system prevent-host-death family antitoxin [Thermoanaerobaculia bacterium]|nr:type II toxin-antitoxin system prevent-host-death family antitoxin [Thermoanaerobaculia bacterium]